jgi:hypothetical protein
MIDENAFGILIAFHTIEQEEYESDDLDRFVDRFTAFERVILSYIEEHSPGEGAAALCLGHAVYIEVAEDSATKGLLGWTKALRGELSKHQFQSSVALSHGGRWVNEDDDLQLRAGDATVLRWSRPSEPLQRALFAHTASHGMPSEADAWGPGLYLDTESLDALGIHPKNEPTRLEVAGASFFRVG